MKIAGFLTRQLSLLLPVFCTSAKSTDLCKKHRTGGQAHSRANTQTGPRATNLRDSAIMQVVIAAKVTPSGRQNVELRNTRC